MINVKTISRFGAALLLCAFLLCGPPAHGQIVNSSTTLAAALSNATVTVSLTSATGVTAPGPNQSLLKVLLIDREIMLVQSISGTTAQVTRGQYGTARVAHVLGAPVWIAPDKAIERGALPSGGCTRTALPFVPILYVAPTAVNSGKTGALFDCMGGQFVQTNAPTTVLGASVSSATSITPTGTFFPVSGTTNVVNIVVPAGWSSGNCLAIEPTGIFATTTAGNIGLVSSATVVGRILFMCWDGSKWWPSYVS